MFEAQKDTVGTNETKKRAVANIELGKTGEPFNSAQEESAFDNLTKTDNSLRSFLNDDWGVGTFAGSIEEKIQSEIGQLGTGSGRATFAYDMQKRGVMIPAAEGETNWYDNITDEDIQAIKAKLMNPETEEEIAISRQVSKEYYVDAQKQQYDKGVKAAQGAALDKQRDQEFKLYQETHKNNLRIELANAKDENERDQIKLKFENEMKKIQQNYFNKVNEPTDKANVKQTNAESQWNAITFDKGAKPVSKAQTYMENFRDVLGDDVTDIRYGTDFVDEQGNTQAKGYYAVINVEEDGKTVQVNQLISKSDDLTYDNVNRYLDPEKMRIKKPLPKPAGGGSSSFDVDAID